MKVVLAAAGSRGDVQPVLEIATVLKQRGHAVKVFVPRLFEPVVAERGLDAGYLRTDSTLLMRSLDSGFRAARQVLTWAASAMQEQFALLLPATEDADVLLTTVNELGAPTIAEHWHIPHVRIGYAPFLPGDQAPAVQPLQRLPSFANRLLWTAVNAGTALLFGGPLNAQRKQLGLPRVRDIGEYSAGKAHNLLALDPVLGPPARGWRFSHDYIGYPFGGDTGPIAPELEQFLAGGPPPVFIGFGSVNLPDPNGATRMLLSAVGRVGCRAVIGQGWAGLGRGVDLPRDVMLVGPTPHRALFLRVAGVVHHGGSGTTHNAARAGVPQAVAPQIIDQYYWGSSSRSSTSSRRGRWARWCAKAALRRPPTTWSAWERAAPS